MNEIVMGKGEIRKKWMGKDEFGRERTGLTKNGKKQPWCNGPLSPYVTTAWSDSFNWQWNEWIWIISMFIGLKKTLTCECTSKWPHKAFYLHDANGPPTSLGTYMERNDAAEPCYISTWKYLICWLTMFANSNYQAIALPLFSCIILT